MYNVSIVTVTCSMHRLTFSLFCLDDNSGTQVHQDQPAGAFLHQDGGLSRLALC